jgi:hypothetical protein
VNLADLVDPGLLGLALVVIFTAGMLGFSLTARRSRPVVRPIPAFARLAGFIGLAVEAGQRLHISLGWRGLTGGPPAASALVGLSVLRRIARTAVVSDRPPVATSGEATLAILSQDTLRSALRSAGAENQYDPASGQLTGLTPFSFAAGALPVIYDEQVAATLLAGHFGSEVGLIADAAERTNGLVLGGSDSLPAQAVLTAAAQEPLIGEDLYAAGAYLQAGGLHPASLRAQDLLRWILAVSILAGAALKFLGFI